MGLWPCCSARLSLLVVSVVALDRKCDGYAGSDVFFGMDSYLCAGSSKQLQALSDIPQSIAALTGYGVGECFQLFLAHPAAVILNFHKQYVLLAPRPNLQCGVALLAVKQAMNQRIFHDITDSYRQTALR